MESSEPFPAWFAIPAGAVILVIPSVFAASHAWLLCRAAARLADRRPGISNPPTPPNDAWRGLGAALGAGVGLAVVVATLSWALPERERARPRRATPEPTPTVERLISRT